MVESCKDLPAWRERVAYFAAQASHEPIPRLHGLAVEFEFVMPRPAYLPKVATPAHAKRPDLSKLVRAAEDALTGVLWEDDSQIADLSGTRKRYAEPGEPCGMRLRWSAIDKSPASERAA